MFAFWWMIPLTALLARVTLADNVAGPGNGTWKVGLPAAHGLDGEILREVSSYVFNHPDAAVRDCFLVVKDGVLVHEEYSSNEYSATKHAGFSMTKTLGALVIGWAQTQGLLDIDADITEAYGVTSPRPYPVTCRHIMSQSIAGLNGPGEEWAYDAGGTMWINVLPEVVHKATGRLPSDIWKNEFVNVLGIEGDLDWQGVDYNWAAGSAGTCRAYARVGQLLLNGGRWQGLEKPLISEAYVTLMRTPQTQYAPYTEYTNPCYGLLTWLNTNPGSDHGNPEYPGQCKFFPRRAWLPKGSPKDVYLASGIFGQLTIIAPSHNLVIVSMGSTMDDMPVEHVLYEGVCRMFPGDCQGDKPEPETNFI